LCFQVKLALAVGEKRLMSPEVAKLFTEAGPSEVVLPDCTQLDAPLLAALLADCATPRHDLQSAHPNP
jgi:DNA repair protein RAD7